MTTQQSISFKPDMIRAILDGRKNNTRRLKGLKEINQHPNDWLFLEFDEYGAIFKHLPTGNKKSIRFPYGTPGEIAWVRETHHYNPAKKTVTYLSSFVSNSEPEITKWTPSIHMKKINSRMDIQIINYKVERVQDISEEDAKAEGVTLPPRTVTMYDGIYRDAFFKLWDEINTDPQFNIKANPWVWAISPFKRVTQP